MNPRNRMSNTLPFFVAPALLHHEAADLHVPSVQKVNMERIQTNMNYKDLYFPCYLEKITKHLFVLRLLDDQCKNWSDPLFSQPACWVWSLTQMQKHLFLSTCTQTKCASNIAE